MTDGIHTGWQHATWAAGYLLGALPAILALILGVALLIGLQASIVALLEHQLRVHRLRRRARRDGRTTTPTGDPFYDAHIAIARTTGRSGRAT